MKLSDTLPVQHEPHDALAGIHEETIQTVLFKIPLSFELELRVVGRNWGLQKCNNQTGNNQLGVAIVPKSIMLVHNGKAVRKLTNHFTKYTYAGVLTISQDTECELVNDDLSELDADDLDSLYPN